VLGGDGGAACTALLNLALLARLVVLLRQLDLLL
jgi:hypothetical protein